MTAMYFRDLSFRTKIVSICLGVSALSLLLAGLALLSIDLVNMRDTLRNKLINQAEIIGQSAASSLVFYDLEFATKLLSSLSANPHIQSAVLYFQDGTLFTVYTKPDMTNFQPPDMPDPDLAEFTPSFIEVARPCFIQNEQVGTIYLRSDLSEISDRLRFSALIFSVVFLAAIAASLLLTWWAQPLIMRPINALTAAARHVAEKGDYSLRVDQDSADELGILANTFNKMLDQIHQTTTQLTKSEQELIGHRNHLEELVTKRTADLEIVNQELRDFAYIVSHDLKAPLRAINQLATWISEDYGSVLAEDGRHQLALMSERVKRMHTLIDGILQYSRIGRLQEQRQDVDLNLITTDTINLLAPPPHIHVRIEGKLPVVYAEKVRMQQLFQNLISNAIKFMDKPRGEIVISASCNNNLCRITVTDNGPGIDEKYHQKIFQIFQTLGSQSSGTDSTGIGLSLVKKIVELHGGTIVVNSKPGHGSQFIFTLEQKRTIMAGPPLPAEANRENAPRRQSMA
jgi:signal transduction histidine kinase